MHTPSVHKQTAEHTSVGGCTAIFEWICGHLSLMPGPYWACSVPVQAVGGSGGQSVQGLSQFADIAV